MTNETDAETLDGMIRNDWDSILFAIVAIKPDKVSIFSIAFFDRFLTEEDFLDIRMKLTQDKPGVEFNLRMAYFEEMQQAREQYLENTNKFEASAMKPYVFTKH